MVEDLTSIREPGVFIVDDVAFIHQRHGFAIGEAIARKGIRKNFWLETRGDVLLQNKEVFQFWILTRCRANSWPSMCGMWMSASTAYRDCLLLVRFWGEADMTRPPLAY